MRITAIIICFLMLCGNLAGRESEGPSSEIRLKNVTRLTFDGDNGEAYFSRDGKRLIFQSNREGYECDKIWTMCIDGKDMKMVSPNKGAHTCSFFFPDGKRILFASTSHLQGDCPPRPKQTGGYVWPLYPYDVFVAGADGSNLRRITDNPKYDAEAVVSPDGREIVFSSQRNGDFDIYVMNSDGSNVRRLTDRTGYDGGPWFSPDGEKIVWRAWYPENDEEKAKWRDCLEKDNIVPLPLDLWVMDRDGGDKKRLIHNGATNWAPSWHPDGKRIIFSSNMDDWHGDSKKFGHNFELYLMNISDGKVERITFNDFFDSFPMFSPDGSRLVFASNRSPENPRATDIFIADWIE